MKIIYSLVFVWILAFPALAQKDWQIADYFNNLPKQFKTFEGDIGEPTAETTLIDNKNGYAAYLYSAGTEENNAYFEMALFKPKKGFDTLVVTNSKYDFVCFNYQTFFLQKRGTKWVDVKKQVLPDLTEKMFFQDTESFEYYKKLNKKYKDRVSDLVMHFYPPRTGTKMTVQLELCDHIDDSLEGNKEVLSYLTVTDGLKPIELNWNKQTGKFEIVRQDYE